MIYIKQKIDERDWESSDNDMLMWKVNISPNETLHCSGLNSPMDGFLFSRERNNHVMEFMNGEHVMVSRISQPSMKILTQLSLRLHVLSLTHINRDSHGLFSQSD